MNIIRFTNSLSQTLLGSITLSLLLGFLFIVDTSSCGFSAHASFCLDSTFLKHETTNIIEHVNETIVSNDSIQIVHGHVEAIDKYEEGIDLFMKFASNSKLHKATVILNGWNLTYQDGSDQVMFVGAALGNVNYSNGTLSWNIAGDLKNEDDTKTIDGKFFYTIIIWNSNKVHLITDEGNIADLCSKSQSGGNSFYRMNNDGFTTSLTSKITTM